VIRSRFILFLVPLIAFIKAEDQSAYKLRVQADYVRVPLSVTDAAGRAIATVKAEDLSVFEDGQARPIVNFVQDQGPVYAALLIDGSTSLQDELHEIKYSAHQFASFLTSRDRICVATFSSDVELLQDWTSSKRKVDRSIGSIKVGFRTALYDAIYAMAEEQFRNADGKRALILLTDGMENDSRLNYEATRGAVLKDSVAVYIISKTRLLRSEVQKSGRVQFLERVLRDLTGDGQDLVSEIIRKKERHMIDLADVSGGRIYFADEVPDYRNFYREVAAELKQQYVLTYAPVSAKRDLKQFKRIEVRTTIPQARLVYRKGYF
jgi:Ca-activated chloride channel family protein